MPGGTETLARVPMFGTLKPSIVQALDARCAWRKVAAREWVIDYEDEGLDVFFVVAGAVRVLIYSKSGREVILADIEAGGFFGELAPIDGHPRSAGVLALSDALVATMPGSVFIETLNTHPGLAMHVLKLLATRVRALDNRVFEYSTLHVGQRICYELLRLAQRDPQNPRRGILESRPTHAEIASRVSTHREAVSRELKRLERDGLLQRQRGTLVLTDMPRLVRTLKAEGPAEHIG